MNGWIKLFDDGSEVRGLDMDVIANTVSWSKSRFDGLTEVKLYHGQRIAIIEFPGNRQWHQFDRMIVPVGIGSYSSLRSHRIVQAQINSSDIDKYINIHQCDYWKGAVVLDKEDTSSQSKILVNKAICDMWVTIVLPISIPVLATQFMRTPDIYVFIGNKGDWCE